MHRPGELAVPAVMWTRALNNYYTIIIVACTASAVLNEYTTASVVVGSSPIYNDARGRSRVSPQCGKIRYFVYLSERLR